MAFLIEKEKKNFFTRDPNSRSNVPEEMVTITVQIYTQSRWEQVPGLRTPRNTVYCSTQQTQLQASVSTVSLPGYTRFP